MMNRSYLDDDDEFTAFLKRWKAWIADQALQGLGYAQSSYAERIEVVSADRLKVDEPQIRHWDDYFKSKALPYVIKEPLRVAYLVFAAEKTKYGNLTSRDYYQRLIFCRGTARIMFERHIESRSRKPRQIDIAIAA